MKKLYWLLTVLLCLVAGGYAPAQTKQPRDFELDRHVAISLLGTTNGDVSALDAQRERSALLIFLKIVQQATVSAAIAMPADKYGFAPTNGEYKGVRSFGQQIKHLSATNHILAAAALGEDPPSDAGDEAGPDTVRTKAEILDYMNGSFAHLSKAIEAIGEKNGGVKPSPISPLPKNAATRLALTVEALIHVFDHYGQMVEYLRMNGVVPPASQP